MFHVLENIKKENDVGMYYLTFQFDGGQEFRLSEFELLNLLVLSELYFRQWYKVYKAMGLED